MRISHVRIRNFRSIEKLDLDLPNLCALVGANNSGKSNLLLALSRVLSRDWLRADQFPEEDRHLHDPEKDIEIAVTLDPPIEYKKFVHADPVQIHQLTFKLTRYVKGEKAGQPRLEQECLDANGKPLNVLKAAPKKGEKRQYEPLVSIPNEVLKSFPLIYVEASRRLSDHLPGARYPSTLRLLFEDINSDFHDETNTVEVTKPDGETVTMPRSERWGQLMKAAMALLRSPEFEKLEDEISQNAVRNLGFSHGDDLRFFFGPCDTLDFYKALEFQVTESGLTTNATDLGDGFQNAVVLALIQAFEQRRKKGAVLLIEEPEISLHPQSQRALFDSLKKISDGNQVIYSTHSPQMVTIPDYSNVRLVRRGSGGTEVVASDLTPEPARLERFRKELDPERNELFFASRLLIVEGDTEKLALPEYAGRLHLDLNRAGASIVEVGGKRNLLYFAELAASFGIPTGIIYDLDSSDIPDDEESEFNSKLEAFANEPDQAVWSLDKNFEDELRTANGDQKYEELMAKYPKMSKPTRGRLIAADGDSTIPPTVQTAIEWLAGTNA